MSIIEEQIYTLEVQKQAKKYVDNITEEKLHEILKNSIKDLKVNSSMKGHTLNGKLKGYRALDDIQFNGVSYRIIFKIYKKEKTVRVMDVGTHEEYNRRLRTGFK